MNQRASRPRILVVDDEPIVRRFAAQILTAAGFDVLTAVDGREAFAIASHLDADLSLVLTDIRMPHLDGLELGRALSTLRPGLPVLYMSGYGTPADSAGVPTVHFIQKPFQPDGLLSGIWLLLPPRPEPPA
jgi:CheY-like chemotaxis protein